MPWRVVIQFPVANQYGLQAQLQKISEMNPLHEAAGGAMRTFTLTVSDEDAATAVGQYAVDKLTETVPPEGPVAVVEVTSE